MHFCYFLVCRSRTESLLSTQKSNDLSFQNGSIDNIPPGSDRRRSRNNRPSKPVPAPREHVGSSDVISKQSNAARQRNDDVNGDDELSRALRLLRMAASLRHPSSASGARSSHAAYNSAAATKRCSNDRCSSAESRGPSDDWKACHLCQAPYCSPECRQRDWDQHKQTSCSADGQLTYLCKRILRTTRDNGRLSERVSDLAAEGFQSVGITRKGCVLIPFADVASAERFASDGAADDDAICYVSVEQLIATSSERVVCKLALLCRDYDPETHYVVAVSIVDSGHASGCVYGAKFRLRDRCRSTDALSFSVQTLLAESYSLSELGGKSKAPDTLVLNALPEGGENGIKSKVKGNLAFTAVPPENGKERTAIPLVSSSAEVVTESTADEEAVRRELLFANVQRRLRHRGVSLRRQYPDEYAALCRYVVDGRPFAPISLYSTDATSGRQFVCVIGPDAEPELKWLDENDNNNNNVKSRRNDAKSVGKSQVHRTRQDLQIGTSV